LTKEARKIIISKAR